MRHANDRDKPDPNPGPKSGGQRPQKATLSTQQVAAIAAIARGDTYDDAAAAAGVHRRTLYEWRTEDEGFRATLDATLDSIRDEVATGLVRAATKALKRLESLAEHSDDESVGLKAATEILNRVDGAAKSGTVGAAEAAVVVQVMATDAAAELRRRRETGE